MSLLWLPLAYAFDAYDLRVAARFSTPAPAMLKAGAITAGVYPLIPYLPPALPPSSIVLKAFLGNSRGGLGAIGSASFEVARFEREGDGQRQLGWGQR